MIHIKANKHDDRSVEFKLGFSEKAFREKPSVYNVNTWIFVPGSLDIDPETYGKKQFYRDIKSNIRLITPDFTLEEIADEQGLPMTQLRKAMEAFAEKASQENSDIYEHHIKLFAAIFKSALRDEAKQIIKNPEYSEAERLCEHWVKYSRLILKKYRQLYASCISPECDPRLKIFFLLGDEFMSRQSDYRCFKILRKQKFSADCGISRMLRNLLEEETAYKSKKNYESFSPHNAKKNTKLVYRYSMLKKFIDSDLYIKLKKKEDGFAVAQLYYSIAAGLAMIFATGIAWFFQLKYGNITWPLFVALVISYMFKDRIKDLMRYYFAHKRLNRYFDHKAHIRIGQEEVGLFKEGFDFISKKNIPQEVRQLRFENIDLAEEDAIADESILLFRKHISIDHNKLKQIAAYPVDGINEILRLHVNRMTLKMDNPQTPVEMYDKKNGVNTIEVQRIYKIHIVMQLGEEDKVSYKHFCLTMTRDGIVSVK